MAEPEAVAKGEDRMPREVWSVRGMNTRPNIRRPKFGLADIDVLSVTTSDGRVLGPS